MLFSKALAGLALLSVSATTMASPTPVSRMSRVETSLTKRVPLVEVPACVEVDVTSLVTDLVNDQIGILGILLNPILISLGTSTGELLGGLAVLGEICVCLDASLLDSNAPFSPGSLSNLAEVQTAVRGAGVLGQVAILLNPVLDALGPALFDIVQNRRENLADCPAPTNGSLDFPQCSTSSECPAPVCDDPAFPQYCEIRNECLAADAPCCPGDQVLCGTTCVAPETPCISGIPGRKRSIKERSRYACRQPLTACPVSHFLARDGSSVAGRGFECLDTRANIESCGGCITPFKGNTAGQDCTAIAHADSVACAAGTCIVESCFAGFTPSGDRSACVASLNSAGFAVQGRK